MPYSMNSEPDERTGMSVQESLFADQARVLEQIALGHELGEILASINRLVERHSPGVLCSILLLDGDGKHLRSAAAQSLPEAYNRAVDGTPVGPEVGSCGAAAFHKKAVFVHDIAKDPKWASFKDVAISYGLRACWSAPIPLPEGAIAGTFAIYSREPRSPNVLHLELLETATHLAGIAIQRDASAESLRKSERRFRATFDQAAAGIVHLGLEGKILRANRRFCELVGYSEAELTTMRTHDITLPEDLPAQLDQMRRLIQEEADTFTMEKRYVREDGTLLWAGVTGSLLRGEGGKPEYFICVVDDISERKRLQVDRERILQREQAARAAAETASHAKDQLLAVVSHELRTPLTPILAAVGLLGRNPSLPADSRHLLGTIKRNAELEARLIDDLLDLTRITNGKIRLSIETVDAHGLINNALDIYRTETKSKGLELSVDLAATHRHLEADPARIQQVFWNLVSNSVKFTPAGGRISVRSSNPSPQRLRVEVADTGIGMDNQVMSRVFSAFEQGEQSLTRRQGGLGLGLSISKALVELHGGTISVESAGKGRGTTFVVEFPVSANANGNGNGRKSASPPPTMRILLVEDNHETAGMMSRLLKDFGHEVTTAVSVGDAMRLAEQRHFDLLISDIGLPDGSGWELMRQLRQRRQQLRGIALSGFGTDEDARHSREAGFLEHMVKPISVHKLEQVLDSLARQ